MYCEQIPDQNKNKVEKRKKVKKDKKSRGNSTKRSLYFLLALLFVALFGLWYYTNVDLLKINSSAK